MLWKWKFVLPRAWGNIGERSKTSQRVFAHWPLMWSSCVVSMGLTFSLWPSQTPLCCMAKWKDSDSSLKGEASHSLAWCRPHGGPVTIASLCSLVPFPPTLNDFQGEVTEGNDCGFHFGLLEGSLWGSQWVVRILTKPGERPMWRGTSLPTPTCQQHQRTSREQHPWVTDFRQQSHRQHLAAASWEGWPRPANQETPKCLAHRKCKITNCSLCPRKSTKLWCCLLHTKRVTNTPKIDWVGVIFVPFYWTIYLQLTDISERLVRLDIVNALRRLWLSQL